jgi:hypothetical protein
MTRTDSTGRGDRDEQDGKHGDTEGTTPCDPASGPGKPRPDPVGASDPGKADETNIRTIPPPPFPKGSAVDEAAPPPRQADEDNIGPPRKSPVDEAAPPRQADDENI